MNANKGNSSFYDSSIEQNKKRRNKIKLNSFQFFEQSSECNNIEYPINKLMMKPDTQLSVKYD